MKILKGFIILLILIFCGTCVQDSKNENFFVKSVKAQEARYDENRKQPSDSDKLEIIKLLISITKVNSKDICNEQKDIYFSTGEFSKYLLENFPQNIKDCKTVLINENEIGKDFKHDYHRFSWWWLKGDLVYVAFGTRFLGGNSGGGDYILEKEKGKWKVKSSKFSASAS